MAGIDGELVGTVNNSTGKVIKVDLDRDGTINKYVVFLRDID